jgi:hypothetical protein
MAQGVIGRIKWPCLIRLRLEVVRRHDFCNIYYHSLMLISVVL